MKKRQKPKGSGRKKGEGSVVKRIPKSLEVKVDELILKSRTKKPKE
jgi:hypothetical protein